MERPTPVLYVDLDGTVRHGYDELGRFVNGPDDVVIFPAALEMMRRWKTGGGRIVAVSNQGGIALGYLTESDCAAAMMRTHELTERLFDKIASPQGAAPGDGALLVPQTGAWAAHRIGPGPCWPTSRGDLPAVHGSDGG